MVVQPSSACNRHTNVVQDLCLSCMAIDIEFWECDFIRPENRIRTESSCVMATKSNDVSKRFLLLYGSQTGQAQVIAELIRDRAVERGFVPNLSCLSQTEKKVC